MRIFYFVRGNAHGVISAKNREKAEYCVFLIFPSQGEVSILHDVIVW